MRLRSRWGSCGIAFLIVGAVSFLVRRAAAGADNAQAEPRSGASAVVLDGDPRAKWFAVFSPDGKTLAAGGDGAILKFWEVGTWREQRTIQAPRDFLRCAAFTRDGKTLAVGGQSGTLTLWDTASGKLIRDFREHSGVLRTINFTLDGQLMVTSGQDKKVAVWETATWRVVRRLTDLPLAVLSSRISPDGKLLAVAVGYSEPPVGEAAPRRAALRPRHAHPALRAHRREGHDLVGRVLTRQQDRGRRRHGPDPALGSGDRPRARGDQPAVQPPPRRLLHPTASRSSPSASSPASLACQPPATACSGTWPRAGPRRT